MTKKRKNEVDEDMVAKLYPHTPTEEVAKLTGADYYQVRNIAIKKQVKKANWEWTDEEKRLLLKHYKEDGLSITMKKLPARSKWSIINKYRELVGLRK